MKRRTGWRLTPVVILCLAAVANFTQAAQTEQSEQTKPGQTARIEEPDKNIKGEVGFLYEWITIHGDGGRFREDNWMTDESTGGLNWLDIKSIRPDENGYEWSLQARALVDYDYDFSFLLEKKDSHYLKLDASGMRRYYDGSNEFWNAARSRMAEASNDDEFVDRYNYNIELGLTPCDLPHFVFGWHRLVKDGKEVLLHGSEGRDPGNNEVMGVPDILNIRWITDTVYGEFSHTFAGKYNVRVRQEWEQLHGNQHGALGRELDINGNVTSDRHIRDNVGYTNWRTMVMLDAFLDEQTYFTANYMYNRLTNNRTRTNWRPNLNLKELRVDNKKRTNVGAVGFRRANVLQVPHLDLGVGARIECSETNAESLWRYGGNLETTKSSLGELRIAEAVRLVYKGIKRTTVSFDADLEQRKLDWDATDTRSPSGFSRRTDFRYLDQIYTLKGVHRFNRVAKTSVKFQMKDLERSDSNSFRANGNLDDYPGWLGDFRRKGPDLTVKTDFRLNTNTSATVLYRFIQESIDFSLGGKTQNLEIHRGAGTLSSSPFQNLFIVGTFMLENYTLDTPAEGTSDVPGHSPYDFKGNSYSILVDGTYAFNKKTSCTLGFRHTEAMGTVDDAGDYVYDKVALTLKHEVRPNQTISLGYQFFNFNNHGGGSFDDYQGHGAAVAYTYAF